MAKSPQSSFYSLKKSEASKTESGSLLLKKKITKISSNIKTFYETFLKRNFSKTKVEKQQYLNSLNFKIFSNEQYDLCQNKIGVTDLFASMKNMKNNKTPGNDGLTKEFYETFWDELKIPLMESVNQAFHTNTLSILQRQLVIKLNEKKGRDMKLETNFFVKC